MNQARQGDVFLQRVDSIPDNAIPIKDVNGNLVLAEGEATGHAHTVQATHAAMYLAGTVMYLKVLQQCYLYHQEHTEIQLPVGDYQITRQRELTSWGDRNVQD